MTKLKKFSLNEIVKLNYGITVLLPHYIESATHNPPTNNTPTNTVLDVVCFQQELLDEINLRMGEFDLDAIDQTHSKKLSR